MIKPQKLLSYIRISGKCILFILKYMCK